MISRSRVHQATISRDGVWGREDEGFSLLSSHQALGTNVNVELDLERATQSMWMCTHSQATKYRGWLKK